MSSSSQSDADDSKQTDRLDSGWVLPSTPPKNPSTTTLRDSSAQSQSETTVDSSSLSSQSNNDTQHSQSPDSSYLQQWLESIFPGWARSSQAVGTNDIPSSGLTDSGLRWHRLDSHSQNPAVGQAIAIELPSNDGTPATEEELEQISRVVDAMTAHSSIHSTQYPSTGSETEQKNDSEDSKVEDPSLALDEWFSISEADQQIEDDYIVVEHDDASDALSAFLISVLASHPNASTMSPKQLQELIDQSLRPVQKGKKAAVAASAPSSKPREFPRVIMYGYYAYLAYYWGATAYALYKRPWIIKLVATGAMKAASFVVVMFM